MGFIGEKFGGVKEYFSKSRERKEIKERKKEALMAANEDFKQNHFFDLYYNNPAYKSLYEKRAKKAAVLDSKVAFRVLYEIKDRPEVQTVIDQINQKLEAQGLGDQSPFKEDGGEQEQDDDDEKENGEAVLTEDEKQKIKDKVLHPLYAKSGAQEKVWAHIQSDFPGLITDGVFAFDSSRTRDLLRYSLDKVTAANKDAFEGVIDYIKNLLEEDDPVADLKERGEIIYWNCDVFNKSASKYIIENEFGGEGEMVRKGLYMKDKKGEIFSLTGNANDANKDKEIRERWSEIINTTEKRVATINEYFGYGNDYREVLDGLSQMPEGNDAERLYKAEKLVEFDKDLQRALIYARELESLVDNPDRKAEFEEVKDEIKEQFDKILKELGLNELISSDDWINWDIAKQTYYHRHGGQRDKKYESEKMIGNPMKDAENGERIREVIVDRHVGYEIIQRIFSEIKNEVQKAVELGGYMTGRDIDYEGYDRDFRLEYESITGDIYRMLEIPYFKEIYGKLDDANEKQQFFELVSKVPDNFFEGPKHNISSEVVRGQVLSSLELAQLGELGRKVAGVEMGETVDEFGTVKKSVSDQIIF